MDWSTAYVWPDEWSAMADWCSTELGSEPVREIFGHRQASQVVGVELADGRTVVIKKRRDEDGRAAACVAAQAQLAEQGFPCARPLTPVSFVAGQAIHAEELVPGGEIRLGDDPATGTAFGALYAASMEGTARLTIPAPLPNPSWVHWSGPLAFPQLWWQQDWVLTAPMPPIIDDTAHRVRARLAVCALPLTCGHADWETQNIRWNGELPHVVHDWDSLAYLPEAALVGVASGMFASNGTPTLAPLESSVAFLDEYQWRRGRQFDREEREIAWAASLWPAVYNARNQVMYDLADPAVRALEQQAQQRLSLADG